MSLLTGTSDTSSDGSKNIDGGNPQHLAESAHTEILFPSEASPMNVTRRIVSPKREEGYFMDDVIVVEVTVTSVKKDGLEDVEIWEVPGSGLDVLNCSYPIVTSSIGQILDYEKSDKSILKSKDLNIKNIIKIFKETNRTEVTHIRNLLSEKSRKDLANANLSNSNKSALDALSSELLRDFNNILDNKSTRDLNPSVFSTSPSSLNDGLDYWINISDASKFQKYIELQDYRLIKRRLLEFAFRNESSETAGIRMLSFDKKHENMLSGPVDSIWYYIPSLRDRESVVFKYYLHPTAFGLTDIRSIIRSTDYRNEEITPLKIIERDPRFEYTYSCATKELSKNKSTTFDYLIKYLGGDKEERKEFTAYVTALEPCIIESILEPNENKSGRMNSCQNQSIQLNFTKGMNDLLIKARYTKDGYTFSPPMISIEKSKSNFGAEISVSEDWEIPVKVHNDVFTVAILLLTMVVLMIPNFLAFYFGRKQLKNDERKSKKIHATIHASSVKGGIAFNMSKFLVCFRQCVDKLKNRIKM